MLISQWNLLAELNTSTTTAAHHDFKTFDRTLQGSLFDRGQLIAQQQGRFCAQKLGIVAKPLAMAAGCRAFQLTDGD